MSVSVFAPATVANVACGFDALGFAIHEPGDEVIVRKSGTPGLRITKITGDGGRLPLSTEKNTAGVSALALLSETGYTGGIEMEIHKKMPLGSGLGSSSASSVAAVVAVNELIGSPFERGELLRFAMEGERAACGVAHADNVGPSLLGGFVLIRSYAPLDVVQLPVPEELWCSVIHPHVEILTEDARNVLRRRIRLEDAVVQWSNLGGLIAGLYERNYQLIGRSLNDIIFEPTRSLLIPGFDMIKQAAMQTGALGCSISGSGPSVFALSRGEAKAAEVAAAMQTALNKAGLESETYVSSLNRQGPVVRIL
ncbi:MAG: homoserine kinase [Candidatus Cyclonatronum sp.]|uniref:homoserine kinase n=1 Tax=Cyclonatronum sp. TaxID=3024185 RepID=UPI0025B9FD0E|nr:homoserine kinase [Cyclonatronum sp.]MCH8485692.1 homoserine kinase [Cyclonatronum sp.]